MDGNGCKAKSVKSFNHVAERHRCPREIWGPYWLDRNRFGRKVFRRFGNSPVLYLEWSRKIFRRFAQLLSHRDVKLFGRELMAVERPNRTRSRTSKSRRKPQKSSERSTVLWPEPMDDDDQAEKTDRLLLSSLRYWEVERDLIEERRSAPNPIRLF
jgi:hypothetical protein